MEALIYFLGLNIYLIDESFLSKSISQEYGWMIVQCRVQVNYSLYLYKNLTNFLLLQEVSK